MSDLKDDEFVSLREGSRRFVAKMLPLFDEIAEEFLNAVAAARARADIVACQKYLHETVRIDGEPYDRRVVVTVIEQMEKDQEAPEVLQRKASAHLLSLGFTPVGQLKLYRDVAGAILRMDTALTIFTTINIEELNRRIVFH